MRVTIVRYARLKNLGNYENERVELEAELGPGDAPAEALDELQWEADLFLYPPIHIVSMGGDDEAPF